MKMEFMIDGVSNKVSNHPPHDEGENSGRYQQGNTFNNFTFVLITMSPDYPNTFYVKTF